MLNRLAANIARCSCAISTNMVAMPLTFGVGTDAACARYSSARNGPLNFLGSPGVNNAATSVFAAASGKPKRCLSVFSKYSTSGTAQGGGGSFKHRKL